MAPQMGDSIYIKNHSTINYFNNKYNRRRDLS